jgi:catechol 2,3-dioxygenase-like lactoylglutathione lyase family enzyme
MTTQLTEATRQSAVDFVPASRVHVGINVANVERSLPFYERLFNQPPTKLRPGYAKFEVAEPPVNFVLTERPGVKRGESLSHMGIQVKSTQAVAAALARLEASGMETLVEEQVTCCYAVQDKGWVTDPDGNRWEIFVVTDPNSVTRDGDAASEVCCKEPNACCAS